MANKPSLKVYGSFATVQAAASTGAGAFSAGSRTTIAAALTTGNEADYAKLDFLLTVSAGTPTENALVHVYRRPKADGSNEAPAPSGSYKHERVGSFVLDNTSSSYFYLFGVTNEDKNATYYVFNDDPSQTLTLALAARGSALDTPA